MPGLGATTAALKRYQRQIAQAGSGGPALDNHRLAEIADFGPNPGKLKMFAYAPPGLKRGAPLVVALHGCTQTAASYEAGAGWTSLADRYGFALVVPQQSRTNNPNRCFNWFEPKNTARGAGEAASIRAMVARAAEDLKCDPQRVHVAGLSAGAAMAAVLLACYPEAFAGGGLVAGIPVGAARGVREAFAAMYQTKTLTGPEWGDLVRAASNWNGPWPRVSIWQGEADATVRPDNAGELIKQWRDVHGLADTKPVDDVVQGHPRRVWRDAAGRDMVEAFTLAGFEHGEPLDVADVGVAGPFMLETGISAAHQMLKFWGVTEMARREAPPVVEVVRPEPAAVSVPAPAARAPVTLAPTPTLVKRLEGVVAKVFARRGR